MGSSSKVSQCNKILQHMREIGGISPMDAIKYYGCMRLAARIADLRKRGYSIHSEMETSRNIYGEVVSYARYTLEEDDGQENVRHV